MDTKLVAEMEMRIFESIESMPGVHDVCPPPIAETLEALLRIAAFTMTHVCPECRKNLARSLEESVPRMLARANTFEDETADRPRYFCGHLPAGH
jgi:hypothetical protein